MMILPVAQFVFFYGYVNLNSIVMSFKSYNADTGVFYFAGLDHFKSAWNILINSWSLIKNSLILYAVNLVIVLGLALVFSYYIAKKYIMAGLFRVILYLPQIVSSIIFVLLYRTLTIDLSLELFGIELLTDPKTQFVTILVFNVWLGFGQNVMLFTGSMSSISKSILESAQIDGVNIVQEFIYITVPSIWGTFVTFVVVGISQIFLNQMHLYTFFGSQGSEVSTFGYFFYMETQRGAKDWTTPTANSTSFNVLSALGVMITVVLVPITLGVKKLLETYGPRTD